MTEPVKFHPSFNIRDIMESWLEDESKKSVTEEYLELYSDYPESLDQTPLWEYLVQFEPVQYLVPEDNLGDFDWDLLCRLMAASFSSDYDFTFPGQKVVPELEITVSTNDGSATARISSLWSFQIENLFRIYLHEQLTYHLLSQDESEKDGIEEEQAKRLAMYRHKRQQAETETFRREKSPDLSKWLGG